MISSEREYKYADKLFNYSKRQVSIGETFLKFYSKNYEFIINNYREIIRKLSWKQFEIDQIWAD